MVCFPFCNEVKDVTILVSTPFIWLQHVHYKEKSVNTRSVGHLVNQNPACQERKATVRSDLKYFAACLLTPSIIAAVCTKSACVINSYLTVWGLATPEFPIAKNHRKYCILRPKTLSIDFIEQIFMRRWLCILSSTVANVNLVLAKTTLVLSLVSNLNKMEGMSDCGADKEWKNRQRTLHWWRSNV